MSRIGQLLGMWMQKGIRPVRPMPQSQQTVSSNTHTTTMKLQYAIERVSELRAKGLTLQAIGQQLGVSRQRVHQVAKADERRKQLQAMWNYGMSPRNQRITASLKLTSKDELINAINQKIITPNMVPNFGLKSYHDLCAWANITPPTDLTYPRRCPHCNETIIHP